MQYKNSGFLYVFLNTVLTIFIINVIQIVPGIYYRSHIHSSDRTYKTFDSDATKQVAY